MDEETKRLVRRLAGFKSHFTRVEAANKRLCEYAPTVQSAATAEALQKGLDKLLEQYDKIAECIEEIQDSCEDEDALEDQRLDEYAENVLTRFEANRALLLAAIAAGGLQARRPVTVNPPAGGAGNGVPRKLSVKKSLKP